MSLKRASFDREPLHFSLQSGVLSAQVAESIETLACKGILAEIPWTGTARPRGGAHRRKF